VALHFKQYRLPREATMFFIISHVIMNGKPNTGNVSHIKSKNDMLARKEKKKKTYGIVEYQKIN